MLPDPPIPDALYNAPPNPIAPKPQPIKPNPDLMPSCHMPPAAAQSRRPAPADLAPSTSALGLVADVNMEYNLNTLKEVLFLLFREQPFIRGMAYQQVTDLLRFVQANRTRQS